MYFEGRLRTISFNAIKIPRENRFIYKHGEYSDYNNLFIFCIAVRGFAPKY